MPDHCERFTGRILVALEAQALVGFVSVLARMRLDVLAGNRNARAPYDSPGYTALLVQMSKHP